ncbi:MAG: hypothetical protein ICV62_06690 [Cyanobacteria bacterium Co-bin13]|nr:hypothetical protein [Cyanobacteria bacterium Co-bin13]
MKPSLPDAAVEAAIAALEITATTPAEKIERLIEIAQQVQDQTRSSQQLEGVVHLYCQALELCDEGVYPLLQARALVGLGAALRSFPAGLADLLIEAQAAYQKALPLLQEHAAPEEIAAAEMSLGLVFQALAQLPEALQSYQRALRVFTGESYPKEHAIVQNNIAIAHLSIPLPGQPGEAQQSLAVQAFEQALKYVGPISHPVEYALLQNNLGNALQYSSAAHVVASRRRALAAYDEAIKVRSRRDTPLEYAHTLANKANVLFNLPDCDDRPEAGNPTNLNQAKALYEEAQAIFQQQGRPQQVNAVAVALADVEQALGQQVNQ